MLSKGPYRQGCRFAKGDHQSSQYTKRIRNLKVRHPDVLDTLLAASHSHSFMGYNIFIEAMIYQTYKQQKNNETTQTGQPDGIYQYFQKPHRH